jgi:acetyl esterase/lipase
LARSLSTAHRAVLIACGGALSLLGIGFFLSPTGVLNALARWGDYELTSDIAYKPGARGGLDIYVPTPNSAPTRRPVVVFIYGGNWETGDKAMYRFVGGALAGAGFVTMIPDYRVFPEVRFPSFVEDAALAVRWARDHAAEYGGDPERIVLMGHSAGAQIAAMLAFDRHYLGAVGLDPRRDVKGLIGLAGPYDFLPLRSPVLKEIFGPESGLAATQPINFVDGGAPPTLLATGDGDTSVKPGNSTRLAARIREHGGTVEVKIYPGISHRTLIGAFSLPLRPLAPVLRDVAQFIEETTGDPAAARAAVAAKRPS